MGRAVFVRRSLPLLMVPLFLVLAGCPSRPLSLDEFLESRMKQLGVPGMSACIVKGDAVVWSGGYGWANVEERRPVTADTLFMLASVSKTVTGTALMQLAEDGRIDLDADVNDYLPFDVRNPSHPDAIITPRMLLTHTSSIRDDVWTIAALYTDGDSPIALGDFLAGYLVAGGEWYDAHDNFYAYAPGAGYNYSNIGATLVGYLVECVAGQPFDQYCEEAIFAPLGMDTASWFLSGLDLSRVAMPYERGLLGRFRPYGHYGYPDYPDGQLRVSVNDYGKFLGAFLNGGEWNGARILEEETVAEMLSVPFPSVNRQQAHVWIYADWASDTYCPGHSGGDSGVATFAFLAPEKDTAVAIFTNGDPHPLQAQRVVTEIADRLLAEAEGF